MQLGMHTYFQHAQGCVHTVKNGKIVLTQFGYLSFLLLVCIVKHSWAPLPALDSKQIKNLIWLFRTLLNVMDECFVNEIAQKGMKPR